MAQGQLLQIKVDNQTQAIEILKKLSWIKSVKIENEYLIVDAPKDSASRVNQALAEHNIFASELVNRTVSLEERILTTNRW